MTIDDRAASPSPPPPPRAERRPTARHLLGRELEDDYAWLAERGSAEALAYLEAENAYAEAVLGRLGSLEESLYAEFLSRIHETDLTVPVPLDAYEYYSRTEAGREYPIYCRRRRAVEGEASGAAAGEEILLDLNAVAEGHDYLRLGGLEVSPDHRLLAYCVDPTGGESFELRIVDLASGARTAAGEGLVDVVTDVAGAMAWANDNETLFYSVRDAAQRPYKVFRHRIGESADEVVFREDDEAFFVDVERTRSRAFILVTSASAVTSEVFRLPADRPQEPLRSIEPRRPGVEYYVDHLGEHLYLRSNLEAPNFRLLRRPLDGAQTDDVEVVPHRDDVKLEDVDCFARHLVLWERRAGQLELRVRSAGSDVDRRLELPEPVYTLRREANAEFDAGVLRFGYTSLVTPKRVYECDLDRLELEVLKQQEVPGGYEPADYVTGRLTFDSDGVAVPVSYVHRSDLEIDGTHPCVLYGYGAYGAVIDPAFSPALVSLLDRGVVWAIAHVRGGGMLGKAWHEGGRMLDKKNSFRDLLAVAEGLIEAGYAPRDGLAVRGGSAGGLLVGAALNMRPDLFRAAVAQVPFVDVVNTMLDPSIPLTVIEYEEWGNPAEPEYLDYMLSYSPYDNVAPVDYPALLVTAGLNDPRVQYWEPAKWVAKLRATATGGGPVVLRTHMGAGHSGPSGRYRALRDRAQEYAFLLDALDRGSLGPRSAGENP